VIAAASGRADRTNADLDAPLPTVHAPSARPAPIGSSANTPNSSPPTASTSSSGSYGRFPITTTPTRAFTGPSRSINSPARSTLATVAPVDTAD
jgi:hypothetical protein